MCRFTGPDFNLFDNVREFMKKSPAANLHLVDPRSIWQLWNALKHHSIGNVPTNPPSSGFIGIIHSEQISFILYEN